MKRIALLGGTFDPLHIGHLAIAEDLRFALRADQVAFVPAAQQPLKAYRHTVSAADRLAMTAAGIANNSSFAISDLEVRRGGVSYTVDTLRYFREQMPGIDLWLITGADAAMTLPRWHEIEQLLALCRIAVVERPGYYFDRDALVHQLPGAQDRIETFDGPALDISASEVRKRLREGRPVRYHLPPAVLAYIQEHRLYG